MRKYLLMLLLAIPQVLPPIAEAAKIQPITVKNSDGKEYKGELMLPEKANAKTALPLVLVAPEWWGIQGYPEMRARKIADELGDAALVLDFYGNAKTVKTPAEAQALATPYYQDPESGVKLIRQFVDAAQALAQEKKVNLDLQKIVAVGYCFGGGQVLNLARAGGLNGNQKLIGVVTFHGSLVSSMKAKGTITPKLLVLHGATDQTMTPKEVAAFKEEMKAAHADLEFHAYPGAAHAFTNPKATEIGKKYKIPVAYNRAADLDSWKRFQSFLKNVLGR